MDEQRLREPRRTFTLAGDLEVRARLQPITRLLERVCGDEEFPFFVSDRASVRDVCSLDDAELLSRIAALYSVPVEEADLHLPIWKLVDVLTARSS
jgi:hypothetical protein